MLTSTEPEKRAAKVGLKPDARLSEIPGYFEVDGAHLYTVLHEVQDPIASVLLIGPFASERHNSYLAWVRWARYLAASGFEVLRFDYRGIGESTGAFNDMTFSIWSKDIFELAQRHRHRNPSVPFVLHGFELGGLFAGSIFDRGLGDALLMWSPPASANQSLRSTFMRWIAMKHLFTPAEVRLPASHYFRQLEEGGSLRVEGYLWSSALWQDSFHFSLPQALTNGGVAAATYKRPVHSETFDKNTSSLLKGGSIGYERIEDLDWLFAANRNWIRSAVGLAQESK